MCGFFLVYNQFVLYLIIKRESILMWGIRSYCLSYLKVGKKNKQTNLKSWLPESCKTNSCQFNTVFSVYYQDATPYTEERFGCAWKHCLWIFLFCATQKRGTCVEQNIHYLGIHDRFTKDRKLSGRIAFLYDGSLTWFYVTVRSHCYIRET